VSEPTPIRAILGLDRDEVDEPQSAEDPSATASTDADERDYLTVDEALVALDGTASPQDTQAPADAVDPAAALTPDQIAALLQENEQYKAREAQITAEQQVEEFETQWGDFYWGTIDQYEQAETWLRERGAAAGASKAEIDAVVYNRVYLGEGLTVPGTNTPMKGKAEWERETLLKYANAKGQFMVARGQQSVDPIAQLAQQYHLDASDTQALAKFRDMPRDKVEELARTLGAKNQRLTSTQTQIIEEANRNVARSLSQGQISPGVPGAPPARKPVRFTHKPEDQEKERALLMGTLFGRRAS
jgi:hypothetical protein